MTFVDEARIFVQAGDGGQGCESYYRDKFMRFPRPDGGDGGQGGDVIIQATRSCQTLLDFKFKQHHKAERGGNASSKNKTGKVGANAILRVPLGTIIKDLETGLILKDLVEDGQTLVVAKGGRAGWGNQNHKFGAAPLPGEKKTISLELKVVADVGFVGFPNAGKSTLISHISKVKSKVANYPFTTKQPILGYVEGDEEGKNGFIAADLPGIIEGAHLGKGLGDRFLRHAERTKILVHMVDMAGVDQRDPLDDYEKFVFELEQYSDAIASRPCLVVANKMDLPQAQENLKRFKNKHKIDIIEVSVLENEGTDILLKKIRELLCQENSREKSEE